MREKGGKNLNLRELRILHSLSISEVARYCNNVTPSAVSKWEDGSSTPRAAQIRKLAELYRLSFDQIKEAIRKSGGNPE